MAVTPVTVILGILEMGSLAPVCNNYYLICLLLHLISTQTSMNVTLVQPRAVVMPHATIQLEAMNAFASMDTQEMDFYAQVKF